ncbi:MAG: class I SAM-dependent methyltransferase [Maribacter sp.]|nr:class I SAM-dependent methyltransferase [Maribacter sp.]
MKNLNKDIERHYLKEGLFEAILNRLNNQNIDLGAVKRSDIAGVDEFHVRGASVSRELAELIHINGLKVLDVGCGLGGPCRMLVDEFNCNVTGIDLSAEFIKTARALSKLVRLDQRTDFVVGDASNLPFEDSSFDVVWTQHVQMNIPDKKRFYSEIKRVLKPEGLFLYYDIFISKDITIEYPMPWASSSDHSFLFNSNEMGLILNELGCKCLRATNQTEAGIEYFDVLIARLKDFGPPNMGLNVLMGESTKPKLLNLLEHLKNGALILESGVYKKESS